MKNPTCSAPILPRHSLASACAALFSTMTLAACVLSPSPSSSPSPSATGSSTSIQAPASVNTAPIATMKGPVLSAPTGSGTAGRSPTVAGGPVTSTSSASLMRDIAVEIGDAACDTDAQCRTLGVGAKACGGPEGYLPWSSKASNGSRLTALAAAHSLEREHENERSGMRSNCSVTQDPGAVCRPRVDDGRRVCQVVPKSRNGAV